MPPKTDFLSGNRRDPADCTRRINAAGDAAEGEVTDPGLIADLLKGCRFGTPLYYYNTTDSTNTRAKELAEGGCPDGTVVLANEQTAGRGRQGRRFYSPANSGIYLSAVVRPNNGWDPSLLTSMCAVAVARAIESVADVAVKIKWVNDLLINGGKVCGILTESGMRPETAGFEYFIIGIGINCGKREFPAELRGTATSIENECGKQIDRNLLAARVCRELESGLERLGSRVFLEESRRRSAVLGKTVTVVRNGVEFSALAVNIDNDGALLVRKENGELIRLNSGEVSIRV